MSKKQSKIFKITPDHISINRFEEALFYGLSEAGACEAAGISRSAMKAYEKNNPEFLERKKALKAGEDICSHIIHPPSYKRIDSIEFPKKRPSNFENLK